MLAIIHFIQIFQVLIPCTVQPLHLLSVLFWYTPFISSQTKNLTLARSLQLLCCQSQRTFSLSFHISQLHMPIPNLLNHPSQISKPIPLLRITALRKTSDESDGHGKRLRNAISYTILLLLSAHKSHQPPPGDGTQDSLSSPDRVLSLSALSLLQSPTTLT